MKRICLYILLVIALQNKAQNDWMLPINMKAGKVKSCVIHKTIPFHASEKDSIVEKFASMEYDVSGRELSVSAYRRDSVLDFRATHKYDSLGNEIEFTKRDFPNAAFYPDSPPKEEGLAKEMYEELHFHNRNIKQVSFYDAKRNLIEKDFYNETYNVELTEDKCYSKEFFIYDFNGRLLEEKKMERSDKNEFETITATICEYDSRGNKMKETIKDKSTGITTITYEYNAAGKMIKELSKDKKGKIIINEYKYSSANDLLDKRCNVISNHPSYGHKYTYDQLQNITSDIQYEADEKTSTTYTYKYQDTLLVEEDYKDARGHYNHNLTRKYSTNNRLISERLWELIGDPYTTFTHDPYHIKLRKFDKDSNIIEEKRYYRKKKKDDYGGKSEYVYNSSKQIIKERTFDDEDSLRGIRFNEYNSKGQIAKVIIFDGDSVLRNTEINFYDSSGVRYARELYKPDKELQLYQTYTYNKNGIENGGIFFQGGPKINIREYFYNTFGLYTLVKVIEKDGSLYFYKYHYTYY